MRKYLLLCLFFGILSFAFLFISVNTASAACINPGKLCGANTTCCSPVNNKAYKCVVIGGGKGGGVPTCIEDSSVVKVTPTPTPVPVAKPPCKKTDAKGKCLSIGSSIGTLDTDPGKFITRVFTIALASSGGIAVLLLMRAGYQMMTARGNPEGLQKAREQMIAVIVGLLFLIFSFVLLQVIGADLLKIPGFK